MRHPDISSKIVAREAIFEALVARAERGLATGRDEAAARAVMTAAGFAWRCPFGRLAEPRLESLLQSIGSRTCVDGIVPARPPAQQPRRILHLVTRAAATGGHTRILSRWISADLDRQHIVVITAQGRAPVPEPLRRAVSAEGQNELHCLPNSTLLHGARSAAEVAATCDRAVIHAAPSDVVPALALAGPNRPVPTVLVNHADHVFWLGTDAADAVAHFRAAAVGIAAKHRGIASARSVIVPIPLDEPAPAGSREAARARLGLHPSDVLILTIASEYKFGDADGGHYLDAVLPAVEANPRIVVRAVGPRPIGPWAAAEKASGGRIVALGEQSEVADYYAAADVYLDSFPVSSFTSMLEAGLAGVPVITRVDSRSRDGFFEFEELDGNAGVIRAVGASEAASALSRWVADTGGRVRAGAELRQMLRATHTGPGWLHSIELAYERATAPLGDDLASADPLAQRLVADLADAHRRGGVDAAYLSAVWKETPGRWAARLTELACSAWAIRREPDLLSAWAARYGERARDRLRSSRRAD